MVAPLGSRLPLAAGHKKQLTPETRKPFAFRHSVPCTLIPRGCNLSELPSISIRCIVSTTGRGIGDGSSRHSTACDTCERMTRNVRERARARCSRVRSCETWRDLPLTRQPAAGHTQHTGYDLINRNNTDVGSSSVCRCSSVWMRLILCGRVVIGMGMRFVMDTLGPPRRRVIMSRASPLFVCNSVVL